MSRDQKNQPPPLVATPPRTTQTQDYNDELLTHAVLRLSGHVLGFVLGLLFSMIIFIATNWLVLKGGSVVGPHLSLLSQYFIGYSVTFVGSLVGVLYAFVFGYLSGLMIAWIYNEIVAMTADKG
jgi:hypothetical protein